MKLRGRTLLVSLSLLVGLLGLLGAISWAFWFDSFERLERQRVVTDLHRVERSLEALQDIHRAMADVWANWDEAYLAAQAGDRAFFSNLATPHMFVAEGIDLLGYFDPQGRWIGGMFYNRRLECWEGVDAAAWEKALAEAGFFPETGSSDHLRGLIFSPKGPAVVAAHSLLRSSGIGPTQGWAVTVRLFHPADIRALGTQLGFPFELFPLDGSLPPDLDAARQALAGGFQVIVAPRNDQDIAGYSILADHRGRPAFLLRVVERRQILAEGKSGFRWLLVFAGVLGIGFGLVQLLTLDRIVLKRLVRLSDAVDEIGRQKNWAGRAPVQGSDEIASLGGRINELLASVEGSRAALEESLGLHRAIVEQANDGIVLIDGDNFTIIDANPALARITGFELSELIGKRVAEFLDEKSDSIEAGLQKLKEDGVGFCGIRFLKHKDGRRVELDVSNGRVVFRGRTAMCGVIRDRTQEAQAARALRRREALLFSAQQFLRLPSWQSGVPEILERLGEAGEVDRVALTYLFPLNSTAALKPLFLWERPGGLARDEAGSQQAGRLGFLNLPGWNGAWSRGESVVVPDSKVLPSLERRVLEAEGVGAVIVVPIQVRGGTWGVISFESGGPRHFSEDAHLAFQAVARIISAVIEQQRNSARVRLQAAALDAAISGVAILDRHGSIRWANAAFARLAATDRSELIGRDIREIEAARTGPLMRTDLAEVLHTGDTWVGEVQGTRADGSPFWESQAITAFRDDTDEVTHFLVIKHDITGRKQAEQALLDAKIAAEAADRAKGQFLANMSHEIRTPLNAIMGLTDLALVAADEQEVQRYLPLVKTSAHSLLGLLDDILDFSRIEAGRLEFDNMDFGLREVAAESVSTLCGLAYEKGIGLYLDIDPSLRERWHGDPDRLRQVLLNLLGNAIKFTERGSVMLSVELDPRTDDGTGLQFSVQDTGIGIAREKLEKIFEPFTQADASNTRRFGGVGLGLAISTRLVAMMGGKLTAQSQSGVGSTFRFTAKFAPAAGSETWPPALGVGERRALLLEPDPLAGTILTRMLTGFGFQVATGAGAEGPFDLLVFDGMLPSGGIPVPLPLQQIVLVPRLESVDDPWWKDLPGRRETLSRPAHPLEFGRALERLFNGPDSAAEPPSSPSKDFQREVERCAAPLSVLLVEDNAVNRLLAARVLERRGHLVHQVVDGSQALEATFNTQFDLVLMDLQMPVMDGLSATRTIREREKMTGGHLPIVAMTANAMKGDREICLEAGMDGYVSKPLRFPELFSEIERVLRETADNVSTAV